MAYQLVDLIHDGSKITLQWRVAPGHQARVVEPATSARIEAQAAAVTEAERAMGAAAAAGEGERGPLSVRLAAAQRTLGGTLFELFDGAERALARRLDDARREGETLHLVVRLRAPERRLLAQHPALGWRLSVMAGPEGALALAPDVTLAVQLGEAEVAEAQVVPGGRLQLLFMAYSPADTTPLLDYEGEEQRILDTLAPFIEEWRLLVRVVEDGSLDELRRRMMRRPHDIVHLTGHGVLTDDGPRLVMEHDLTGERDDVSAERLLKALKAGSKPPRLVVISSCHSAERRDDLPSFAAELVLGGIPAVIGWNRPVREDISSLAAEELYHRLCAGDEHGAALASARRRLDDAERDLPDPEQAWAMLELFATRVPGFRISDEPPVRDLTAPGVHHRRLGAQMRVMTKGFVGRRRELQQLGRLLRHGGAAEHPVAGALIVGMKGSGKSSLVGRAVDRHQQDGGELLLVVLHGALDELTVLDTFRTAAVDAGDAAAVEVLADRDRAPIARIEWLLRSRWMQRRAIIILDDFEQNLDLPSAGDARLRPLAMALLEVLLPACRDHQPKLLITCTSTFELPAALRDALVTIPLGPLDGASIRKLWLRGRRGELAGITTDAWSALAQRLGGNPRILEWARQLLGERSAERMAAQAQAAIPAPTGSPLDDGEHDALAARFLRDLAYDEAATKVGGDVMTFVARARVYDLAVPIDALTGLDDGLAVTLDAHVPALANLGLLETSGDGARTLFRVSPLVEPAFTAPDPARWHAVAAAYWWKQAVAGHDYGHAYLAWRHALAAGQQELADLAADDLNLWLDRELAYASSADLSARHVAAFPSSVSGLNWAGYAQLLTGHNHAARALLERGVAAAAPATTPRDRRRRSWVTENLARVLVALGDDPAAEAHLRTLLDDPPDSVADGKRIAAYRYSLATLLHRREQLAEARTLLDEALVAARAAAGTDEDAFVTPILSALAGNQFLRGDLAGATAAYRHVLDLEQRLYSAAHPHPAATHHALATVLGAAGDLPGALDHAGTAVELMRRVYGGDRHEDVAHVLAEQGALLRRTGAPAEARTALTRALDIIREVHGSNEHRVAAAVHHELAALELATGDAARAVALFDDALARKLRLYRTPEQRSVAATYQELAGALARAGRPDDAAAAYGTALGIYERVLGTRAHYLYARCEALSRAGTA